MRTHNKFHWKMKCGKIAYKWSKCKYLHKMMNIQWISPWFVRTSHCELIQRVSFITGSPTNKQTHTHTFTVYIAIGLSHVFMYAMSWALPPIIIITGAAVATAAAASDNAMALGKESIECKNLTNCICTLITFIAYHYPRVHQQAKLSSYSADY